MKIFMSLALVTITAVFSNAQTPPSSAPSKPSSPPPSSTPPPQQRQQQQRPAPGLSQSLETREAYLRRLGEFPLNPVSESDRLSSRVVVLHRIIAPLYRKPSNKELKALIPDSAIMQKHSVFLENEDTGIFKLVPDTGCVNSDKVVSVKEECVKYSFPGSGNSFSFRTGAHRLRHLGDITYVDDKLRITGVFMHGMIVDMGDIPIEVVTLFSPGMKPLTAFQPTTVPNEVVAIDKYLTQGIKSEQFVYAKEVDPVLGRTYALRSVAYRGKVTRSAGGVRYNELDYDKRRDVIVAFRIVEKGEDKDITIVWKKLAEREAPKIKMPKKESEETDAGGGN